MESVQSYGNGSKVTLKFGNLTSASLKNLKAKLEWGNINSKGDPDFSNKHSREIYFVENFKPGSWTSSSIVLEGVKPADLGYV